MITSYGYQGTIGPGASWADFQVMGGVRYAVQSVTAGMVVPSAATPQAVDIRQGWIGGWGIADRISGTETVTLDAPGAGSGPEYYLIVARRTWQNINATAFAAIDLGQTLPSGYTGITALNQSPGSIDDQLLAVASIGPTDTAPTIVYDLRTIGTGKGTFNIHPATPLAWIQGAAFEGLAIEQGGRRLYRRSVWTTITTPGTATWADRSESMGQVNMTAAAGSIVTAAVTFPANRFTTAPLVFLTDASAWATDVSLSATPITATGFTINLYSSVVHTHLIQWLAKAGV